MATGPDLRVGDADREAVAAGLREHYAQGRLTLEEFNQRLDATFTAATRRQLDRVTTDLPHVTASLAPLPATAVSQHPDRARRDHQHGGRAGQDYQHRGNPGRRALSSFVALAATLLIMIMVVLPEIKGFPLPGKLGILIAIFAVLRGLLRRIMGSGRGRFSPGRHYHGPANRGGPWSGGY